MEQVRLLLAIGLSFLVLFVWSMFFADRQPVDENAPMMPTQSTLDDKKISEKTDLKSSESTGQKEVEAVKQAQAKAIPAREITVDTPYYRVRISVNGASFTSFILKKYRETVDENSPYKELIPQDFTNGIIRTSMVDKSLVGLDEAVFSVTQAGDRYEVRERKQSIEFNWIAGDGSLLTKTYTFDPNSYLIDLKIALKNRSEKVLNDKLVISVGKQIEESDGYGFVGPSALIDNRLEQIKIKNIEDQNEFAGSIKWIGVQDRYFISSIIPATETKGNMKLSRNDDVVVNRLINPSFELSPGSQQDFQFLIFMGPKSMALLDSLGHDLGKALNFGFFNFIAKPCLWFMHQIHNVIPNYGIAIILLTVFTKILLWPLGSKSYKSMSEMKKLQPLMTEIREKYKDDKQKMNQELMALYRTYKVNPLGGCLPMVLQIPVFFALYRMLYEAIELRHAPFFLWINDLSAPDRLFDFGFSIPFMQPPYGIPVLTIIMGGTMLLQQKMSPPPGDPTQAKMMMLMPVVFTFIFINFSSGLVLYWLVNNILSISQQYYVQKKTI